MEFLHFEETDDLELIKLVEVNHCLYDKKLREFKIVDKKEVWTQIGAALTKKRTGDHAQRRWESLRSMWSRQHKKHYEQGRSGSGTSRDTQEFQHYGELPFLIPHYSSRQTKSNMKRPLSCTSNNESSESQFVINKPSTSLSTVMEIDLPTLQWNTDSYDNASLRCDDNFLPSSPQQDIQTNEIHKSDTDDHVPFSPTAHAVLEKCSSKQSSYKKTCIKEKYKQKENCDANIKVPEPDEFCKKKKVDLDNYMHSSTKSLEKMAQSVEDILLQKTVGHVSNNDSIDNDTSDMLKCAYIDLKQVRPDKRFDCIVEVLKLINSYKEHGQTND